MLAFTFPGQGSQRSGMGHAWVEHPSWEVAAEASEIAGRDLTALLLDAPMEELTLTANAQLATFVMSLVVLDAVERLGLFPAACAGHSLGEYTALVASGALSFSDGTRLVLERGDAMQEAADERPGTMAALIGIADDDAEAACQRAEDEVWVANYNAPGQVVIAGTVQGVAYSHRPGQGARSPQGAAHPGFGGLPHPADAPGPGPAPPDPRRGRPSTPPRCRWWRTWTPGSTPTRPTGPGCSRPSCAVRCGGASHSRPSAAEAPPYWPSWAPAAS